jgi:hypothetical protein
MGKQNGNMGKTLALNRDSFFFFVCGIHPGVACVERR